MDTTFAPAAFAAENEENTTGVEEGSDNSETSADTNSEERSAGDASAAVGNTTESFYAALFVPGFADAHITDALNSDLALIFGADVNGASEAETDTDSEGNDGFSENALLIVGGNRRCWPGGCP